MEKALFYNALPDASQPTGYDRAYNADDISDWLDAIMTTGVIKTDTGLKVTAAGGMVVSVNAGKAVINGKPYRNDSVLSFAVDTAPTGSTARVDLIVLRFDRTPSVRNTYLRYVKGTGADIPAIVRTDTVYELALAAITVAPSVTAITQTAIRDLRGDAESVVTTTTGQSVGFCPYMVAAKGYEGYYDAIVLEFSDTVTMTAQGSVVEFNIPQYGWTGVDILNVYTNGVRERSGAYSVSGNAITFVNPKVAGTVVEIVVQKFIDGEGLGTVLEQYEALQAEVLTLANTNEYKYICSGINDNIKISNIVKTFLQGGADYGTMKLSIYGNIGMTTPARGDGTSAAPFGWFDFNIQSNRNAIVDFSCCGQIAPPITGGTYNTIFHSNNDIHIIGANVVASNTEESTIIRIINTSSGVVYFENCRFWITAYQDSLISLRGTFINCRGSVANVINNSYCFLPHTSGIVRIIGGEYYAYTGDASAKSAVVGQSGADAVSVLYGVNAPTAARSGFYQTNSIIQFEGGGVLSCTDLISALPLTVVSGISNIRGTIAKSKAGAM